MHNYSLILVFLLSLFSAEAKAAEEEVSFRLLNDDFEVVIELGPAFVANPVYEARGALHPKVRINYKQPRYVGATLGWWANDYLLLQWGVNFTSADFKSGEDIGGDTSATFDLLFSSYFKYRTDNSEFSMAGDNLTLPASSVSCDDGVVSIYCATRTPLVRGAENDFLKATPAAQYSDYFSLLCNEACALGFARTALMTDEVNSEMLRRQEAENKFLIEGLAADFNPIKAEVGRIDITSCGEDCQLTQALSDIRAERARSPVQSNTYVNFIEGRPEYTRAQTEVEREVTNNKERCLGSCLEQRVQQRTIELINNSGEDLLEPLTGAAKETFIRAENEYTDAGSSNVCRNVASPDVCLLVEAERLIQTRGERVLQEELVKSNEETIDNIRLRDEHNIGDCSQLEGNPRLTCALVAINQNHQEANTLEYNNWLAARPEYTTALASATCSAVAAGDARTTCARTQAASDITNEYIRETSPMGKAAYDTAFDSGGECEGDDACALVAARTAITTDEASRDGLNTSADSKQTEINDHIKAVIAAVDTAINIDRTTVSAGGTFLSVGSFFNVYGNYPITRVFSIYGGGGVGFVWTKVAEGLITRTASANLEDVLKDVDVASILAEENLAPLAPSTLMAINTALDNLSHVETSRRDISDNTFSYALSFGAGVRTEVFEGVVIDAGYQGQWNPKLYKQAESDFIHQVRIGFVFKF